MCKCPDCLEVVTIRGSVISPAVAGTVLGAAKDPGILEEKTARTIAPGIPATSEDTSAASSAF